MAPPSGPANPGHAPAARLEALGPAVWAWVQPGGRFGVANAGVVADDDGLTVVDTLMVPAQWQPFAAAVEALGAPVRRVVLTNAHIDHVGGTWAFRWAAVYGSPATSAQLDLPADVGVYRRMVPDLAADLDALEAHRAEIAAEEVASPLPREVGLTRAVTHEVDSPVTLTPRVELLPVTGHTDGDLVVVVADAEVAFLGGLGWYGSTPLALHGDPTTWADVLDVVADLADVLVPGHGPVGDDAARVAQQGYLRACVAADGDPAALGPGPWDGWVDRRFDAVNVERAALLARGDRRTPPAMLRLLGM
jgi:glyoxylase-like metal-dependent hydrolase (beta-lactamase superfamily II)